MSPDGVSFRSTDWHLVSIAAMSPPSLVDWIELILSTSLMSKSFCHCKWPSPSILTMRDELRVEPATASPPSRVAATATSLTLSPATANRNAHQTAPSGPSRATQPYDMVLGPG